MVLEVLCEKVVEVRRETDRVMPVVAVFEEDVLRLIRGYALQSGRSLGEKQSFYDELKCEWDMHCADYLVMCWGDFSGHIARHIYGFLWVHGGYCVGQTNFEGRMLLELCLEKELCQLHGSGERERGRCHSE